MHKGRRPLARQVQQEPVSARQLALYRAIQRVRSAPVGVALKAGLGLRRRLVETKFGMFSIDPASHFGLALLTQGSYEPVLVAILLSALKEGDVFVDVGANEGYFTVLAARLVGCSGRVVAVEPQQRMQQIIGANIELNHLANVHVAQVAVSDTPGTSELYLAPSSNTGATGLSRSTRYPVRRQKVTTMPLIQLFDELGITECSLLKIDIEGHEYEAIIGSAQLFRQRAVRTLAVEFHMRQLHARGKSESDIHAMMDRCGYAGPSMASSTLRVWTVR